MPSRKSQKMHRPVASRHNRHEHDSKAKRAEGHTSDAFCELPLAFASKRRERPRAKNRGRSHPTKDATAMHAAPEDEHQADSQVFSDTGSARLSAPKPQNSWVEDQREQGIPWHLQLVGPKTYRCYEKENPSACPPRSQFDQKKSCPRHAGYHQHLEAESAKKRMAKIQRDITQPLPAQLAPELRGIPG